MLDMRKSSKNVSKCVHLASEKPKKHSLRLRSFKLFWMILFRRVCCLGMWYNKRKWPSRGGTPLWFREQPVRPNNNPVLLTQLWTALIAFVSLEGWQGFSRLRLGGNTALIFKSCCQLIFEEEMKISVFLTIFISILLIEYWFLIILRQFICFWEAANNLISFECVMRDAPVVSFVVRECLTRIYWAKNR